MSDSLLPIDEKERQVSMWLKQCLDIVRDKMLRAGYPIDDYDIRLRFNDGEIQVVVRPSEPQTEERK